MASQFREIDLIVVRECNRTVNPQNSATNAWNQNFNNGNQNNNNKTNTNWVRAFDNN